MRLRCEFSKKSRPLEVVSVQNIEFDDSDAQEIIADPSNLNSAEMLCICAQPISMCYASADLERLRLAGRN